MRYMAADNEIRVRITTYRSYRARWCAELSDRESIVLARQALGRAVQFLRESDLKKLRELGYIITVTR